MKCQMAVANTTETDIADQKIYREEFLHRLPEKILDAHVHIWDQDAFPPDFHFPSADCCNRFGGIFTLEMHRQLMAKLLPGHAVSLNCFGTPHALADRDRTPLADNRTVFAMALIAPEDSPETLHKRVELGNLIGFKPYINYGAAFTGKAADEVEIADMMTPDQLNYINAAGLAVTLHIPRPGRFADLVNQRQMVALCRNYPNAKFIFAHIGRAYFLRNVQSGNLDELAEFPNAYLDTAMVNHEEVLAYTFDHFPVERILFGSDAPIALLRGKSVEVNHQYVYLMGENYRIGNAVYAADQGIHFTTFFYEQLRALLHRLPEAHYQQVFYQNADQLFRTIARRMPS